MTWRDSSGARWAGRKRNGWPIDDKAPDGFTVAGYRTIDRKGRVRFDGGYWTHKTFSEKVGQVVRVYFAEWPGRVVACVGAPDTNPENLFEDDRHSAFYSWRNQARLDPLGDWNKRPTGQRAAIAKATGK